MNNIILLGVTVASLLVAVTSARADYQFPPNQPQVYTQPAAPAYYPQQPVYYPAYPQQYLIVPQNTAPMQPYYGYNPYMAGMQPQQPAPQAMASAAAPAYQYTSPYNPNMPATPGPKPPPPPEPKKEVKPWGDTRYIWPDFYTDATGDWWDKMFNAPHDLGYMPGGWRFPSFSSPDPVTVGDAVANQMPPIMEEVPNFMNFTN